MKTLELSTAIAVAGVSAFSVHALYTQHAGKLTDARQAPAGDPATSARLQDADVLAGAMTVLVGGSLAVMTKNVTPLVLALLAFGVVAVYYHTVCESHPVAAPITTEDDTNE